MGVPWMSVASLSPPELDSTKYPDFTLSGVESQGGSEAHSTDESLHFLRQVPVQCFVFSPCQSPWE